MDQFDRDSTIADFKNGVCNLMVRPPHIMLEIKFILDLCFETLKSPHVLIKGLWADTMALVHEFSRLSHRLQPPWQREAWMWNSWSWLWIMTVRITMKIMYIDVGELGLTLSKVNSYLYLSFWCNKPQKAGIGYMGFFPRSFCFASRSIVWRDSQAKRGGKIATCASFFLPVSFAFSVNGEWDKCFTFTSKIYFGPAPGKRSLKWNTAVLQQVVLERPSNLNSRQSQREELILCQILFIFVLEFVFTTAVLKDV